MTNCVHCGKNTKMLTETLTEIRQTIQTPQMKISSGLWPDELKTTLSKCVYSTCRWLSHGSLCHYGLKACSTKALTAEITNKIHVHGDLRCKIFCKKGPSFIQSAGFGLEITWQFMAAHCNGEKYRASTVLPLG